MKAAHGRKQAAKTKTKLDYTHVDMFSKMPPFLSYYDINSTGLTII